MMNVLILGLGSIAKKHINALRELRTDVHFYALRSSVRSVEEDGITNVYTLDELNSIKLNFCIISSPTSIHLEHIELLLTLKLPLFIEKPLSHTLEIEILKKDIKGVKTYVACNLRFLDSLNFVKKELKAIPDLMINEVQVYCGSYLPDWRPGSDFRKVYSSIPELGGGVHLDLIHELDYIYWLFGHPNSTYSRFQSKSSLAIKAVDSAYYQLSYESFECLVSLNYFRRKPKREIEIVCNLFTLKVDLLTNTVYKDDEIVFSSDQRILDTYKAQLKYFMEEETPFNDFEEALDVLKICLS